jgi:molybdopterin synthase sulfur carrier subunit
MARINIPTLLRHLTNNYELIDISGSTAKVAILNLVVKYPLLRPFLLCENQEISNFVNIYLNNHDIRFLSASDTKITEMDSITIIPAMAGG